MYPLQLHCNEHAPCMEKVIYYLMYVLPSATPYTCPYQRHICSQYIDDMENLCTHNNYNISLFVMIVNQPNLVVF